MDNLETPYDEEAEFIECKICDKSIRGDTLYKIHLTTPGHIKKEDAFVAAGLAVRKHNIPVFEDILQYLDYMKLDEPIIGLDYLDEVPSNDPRAGPKYTCRLCHHNANLPEMVHHVIGRKHRQKYVELKRPDLVTWDKQSIITQGGKIIRARAEIIERQDGRGTPMLMAKKSREGKLNISKVPPRQKQNRDRNTSQRLTQQSVSHIPRLMDYPIEYPKRGRFPPGHPNVPLFHPEGPHMLNRERPMHQWQDGLRHDHMEEEPWRVDYRESDQHRWKHIHPDHRREYEEEYVEDPHRRNILEPSGYDSRMEMPRGHAQRLEHYPEEAPPHRRPYQERDPLTEFCPEEIRRGPIHSVDYQHSHPVYPESDDHRWSLDGESERHDSMIRAGHQGASEPEARSRSFPRSMESDQSRDHLFNMIRDDCHETREPHRDEAVSSPGPSRTRPPNSHRQVELTRSMSNIPEPFRRFLKGASNDEEQGKRKRKSRFSDATAEEVETTKEMFNDEYGPPNPKFASRPRPLSAPLRPESHGREHPDLYRESKDSSRTESYQRGGSESEGVFDMLKNIEIENAEEADFLKNKLCNLLKEFKTKKSEKAVQNSHSRAVISKDYNNLKPDPEPSPRRQYETVCREDSDLRQPEDLYFKDDRRGRDWKRHEHIPDERLEEYHQPSRGEARQSNSNRNHFERWPEMSLTQRATHPDEPARYPERFQEPAHPRDYRPAAAEEFFDPHSSAPPLHMERGPLMDRGPLYSNKLDKITSALLELVARK